MDAQLTASATTDTAGRKTPRSLLSRVIVAVAGLLMLGVVGSCGWWVFFGPDLMVFSNTLSPQEQYRIMTGLEPTPDVTNIEGIGGGWQGHDFWLRFRCDEATMERLVALGFEPALTEEVRKKLNFAANAKSFNPDHFTPEWDPGDLETQKCFKIQGVRNDWTESGETYFAYDASTGWIHLYSSGT